MKSTTLVFTFALLYFVLVFVLLSIPILFLVRFSLLSQLKIYFSIKSEVGHCHITAPEMKWCF